jgi:diacylglycerol kinase family enzyme
VAIGGDGTIRLVAHSLHGTGIRLGILPAGSANGLAKELGIPEEPAAALKVITDGQGKKIHVTIVNGHWCIHLADVGFNAHLIKTFDAQNGRGMWGYFKAAVKILFKHPAMQVELHVDGKKIPVEAAMVVLANGTRYGSGAVINPLGSISDELFEVIAVKKISANELFKMRFSHADFDPEKTEIFQTRELNIRSRRKVHFQVDGEYLGKVYEIEATILPNALTILVPDLK